MTERDFPDYTLGFHGNMSSCSIPSVCSPLLLEEARHLVYVFCDRGNSSKLRHKQRCRRTYCSLCRHFHKEPRYNEGFEKHFERETVEDCMAERYGGRKVDLSSEKYTGNQERNEGKGWETLTVEGLKMYKVNEKRSQRSFIRKRESEDESNSQKNKEHNKGCVSARNGCATCEKRRNSLQQNQEVSVSNKRIIKVVLPQVDSKPHLSDH